VIFAYSLCVIFGLIIGSLQIIRNYVLSELGWHIISPYIPEDTIESWQAFLIFIFGLPVLAAVFYSNPWVIVDNFVTGENAPVLFQFSVLKLGTFFIFLGLGEFCAAYYYSNRAYKQKAQYQERRAKRPEYKYNPDMSAWREWRRQTANSGHPDWTPPEQGSNNQSAGTFYINPEKQKHLNVLGLKAEVSPKKIHRQYLKMAKRFHPDALQYSNATAQEKARAEDKMKEINAAYEWLKRNP